MKNDVINNIEIRITLQIITSFIIPIFTSLFIYLFSSPKKDEEELNKKRQNLLLNIRNLISFKINDISNNCLSKICSLVKKSNDEIDEDIPKSGEELNGEILLSKSIMDYIFANSNSLKSAFDAENQYKSAKKMIRFYKYSIIFLPFLSGILYICYLIFINKNIDWTKLIIYIISIFVILIGLWFIKEKKKDKYYDMSDEIEGL